MQDDIFLYKNLVTDELHNYLRKSNIISSKLLQAIEYSLFSGGKFIRSSLLMDFCNFCSGRLDFALPFACAVEMVHTYSLIHDDLPCMDDDSFRRGKPSNHVANGENFAVLAGDALFSLAAEILTEKETEDCIGPGANIKACNILFNCCGASGMIDGQALDLTFEDQNKKRSSFEDYFSTIKEIYFKKTGKLIGASCALGCIAGNANKYTIDSAKLFGEKIGIVYQILDDIKDGNFKSLDSGFNLRIKEEARRIICEARTILNQDFRINKDKSYAYHFLKYLLNEIEKN